MTTAHATARGESGLAPDPWNDWRSRRRLRRCDHVGSGTCVLGDPYVRNPGSMRIGRDVILYSRPVRLHLVTGGNGALTIGDRVIVGHGAGLTAYEHVDIGAETVIGPFVMIMDTDFHDLVHRRARGATAGVRIGRGVVIGAWAMVLRGTEIGDGAVIAPGSVVRGRIAAGARVEGTRARGGPTPAAAIAWPVRRTP